MTGGADRRWRRLAALSWWHPAVTGSLRLATAATCVVALIHRLFWGLSSNTIAGENFFAYLTIESNIFFVVVWTISAFDAFHRQTDPRWLVMLRTVALSWTTTAGIVFAFLVWQAGERAIRIDVPWSDQLLHFFLPAFAIVDWAFAAGRRPAPWRVVPIVLAYPLVWAAVTMWRGTLIGWYPYYFLDLRQISGPLEFVLTGGAALGVFAVVSVALVLISRRRYARRGMGVSPSPRRP
ncbi:Pr6Pr family membrane protein [Microbacterium stercoris]|uniref:Pr6Pr family membrane protein n=1 Tax=Microbacterium stercoris TaxID=2820289 RepID=UPI0027DADD22|nr:Pr6Pr family membrane protein [Microbacterium stercoris]